MVVELRRNVGAVLELRPIVGVINVIGSFFAELPAMAYRVVATRFVCRVRWILQFGDVAESMLYYCMISKMPRTVAKGEQPERWLTQ